MPKAAGLVARILGVVGQLDPKCKLNRGLIHVSKSLYHLVFEITALAFSNPAFGLDVCWFLSWPLVLD